jgi:hypothetical protein
LRRRTSCLKEYYASKDDAIIEAGYDEDKDIAYFVAENISTPKRATELWMHEQVGHKGIEVLFDAQGADFNEFLDFAYDTIKRSKKLFEEVKRDYASDLKGESEQEQKRTIVREVIARRAEKLSPTHRKQIFQKFLDWINKWIKKITGYTEDPVELKMQDIDNLLEAAKNRILTGEVRDWLEFKESDAEYKSWAKKVLAENPGAITWYDNPAEQMETAFGDDSRLITMLLSITSAGSSVRGNLVAAAKTYVYLAGGRDKPGGRFPSVISKVLERVKAGDMTFSSQPKIDEFTRALVGDPKATVNDRWMHRLFFGPALLKTSQVKYTMRRDRGGLADYDPLFSEPENTASRHKLFQLTEELNKETDHVWTPRNLQAALWIKAVAEAEGKSPSELKGYDYNEFFTFKSPTLGKEIGKATATPWEYVQAKVNPDRIGSIAKEINLPKELYAGKSNLQKQYERYAEKHGVKPVRYSKRDPDENLVNKYIGKMSAQYEPPKGAIKPIRDVDVEKQTKKKIAFDPRGMDLTPQGLKEAAARIYTAYIMQEFPIKRLFRQAGPEYEKAGEEQIRRRRGYGGIVEAIITAKSKTPFINLAKNGIKEYSHLGNTSLQKILNPIKSKKVYRDYERMREAERDLALWTFRQEDIRAGKLKGIDPKNAKKVIQILKHKYGEKGYKDLQKISRQHTKFEQDAVLKPLLKSGWMSQESYDAILDKPESEFHASYLREMEDVERQVVGRGADPVKRIYGSEKKKIPSTEGTISNIIRTVRLVEKLRLNKDLVALKDVSPDLAEVIQEKKPNFQTKEITFPLRVDASAYGKKFVRDKNGNKVYQTKKTSVPTGQPKDTVVVAENGKKKYYTMPADVLNALEGTNPVERDFFFKMVALPTRLLRSGATLSAEFMMRNPARDQLTAFVYSKYGYNPFTDFPRGLIHTLFNTEVYQEFKAAGAENSFFVSLDRQAVNLTAKDMTGAGNKIKYVKNPIEALRVLSELSEKGTRVGLYNKARKKGATPQEAATEAREGTLDFGRIGTVKSMNQLIAFWNANLQGTDKLFREMKNGRAWLKAFFGITVPSLILWGINHDEERYKELPAWRKNFFWNIIPEAIGLPESYPIISIPKPFELGLIFGSLPERILDWRYLNDPEATKDIAVAAGEGALPGLIPTAALPYLEHITNYSFFRGQSLEPKSMENLPNWMRYTSRTTNTAKEVGKLTDLSPVKLENWVRNWTGTLGSGALAGFDRAFMGDDIPDVGKHWYEQTPGIKGFISRDPSGSGSKSVEQFYENAKAALTAAAGYKFLTKWGEPSADDYGMRQNKLISLAAGARKELTNMAEMRQNINRIINDKQMSPEKKRKQIDQINGMITQRAKMFNEIYNQMIKEN